jgi:hypothetical protein
MSRILRGEMRGRKWHARAGWEGYTSWYVLPTIRVGRWFVFVTWLKFDAGMHLHRRAQ